MFNYTPFFFHNLIFYKNIEAEISEILKHELSICLRPRLLLKICKIQSKLSM